MTNQIITTDTTWTSGSIHVLTDPVQIAYGATLTIQPGAVVRGGTIQVFGSLDTEGTSDSNVLLDGVDVELAGTNTQNATISMNNTIMRGGEFMPATGNAVYGSYNVSNSRFEDVSGFYLWYPTANSTFEHNIFHNSEGLSTGLNGVTLTVNNSTFAGWLTTAQGIKAAIENWASYGSGQVTAEHDDFLDSGRIALELDPDYSSAKLAAVSDYFGTSDAATIASMIYDQSKDLQTAGLIANTAPETSPDPAAWNLVSSLENTAAVPITAGNTVYYGSSSTYWAVPPYPSPGNSASPPSVATLAHTLLADVQYSVQPDGSVLLTGPFGTDTLVAFDKIDLTNATITISASGSSTATLKPGCTDTGAHVNWKDQTTGLTSSTSLAFSSNSGPSYLDWQYLSPSNDTTSISTQADNVFIRGGSSWCCGCSGPRRPRAPHPSRRPRTARSDVSKPAPEVPSPGMRATAGRSARTRTVSSITSRSSARAATWRSRPTCRVRR